MQSKGLRIVWLQDLNIFSESVGGAERSDRAAVIEGLRRGHDITVVNPNDLRLAGVANFDLAVVSNAASFNQDEVLRTCQLLPHVMYLHDYYPLCKWRLFFSAQEKCKACEGKKLAEQLLCSSALNIFLSPLHFQTWCTTMPELAEHPHHFHPSPVDTKIFKPLDVQRKSNSVLGVNSLIKFKGAENAVEYARQHPEFTFTFVGIRDDSVELPRNAVHLGYIANSTLPEMYSQAEYFISLPSTPQPCERTAIEAKLCGAKLILNDNVGIASYPEFNLPREDFAKWIAKTPARLWERIEGEIKKEEA